jgi:hypothetical protein
MEKIEAHRALFLALASTTLTISVASAAAAQPSVVQISVTASRHPGAAATDVSGQASPYLPVMVTAYGLLSTDLPTVFVGEVQVRADAAGHFTARIDDNALEFTNSTLDVVVSSLVPGLAPARTRIILTRPNLGSLFPADLVPPEDR